MLELDELIERAAEERLLVLRPKLLLLIELPKLERELVFLDNALEPLLRLDVLRDELTDDCRAARLEVCRLEDCKDLALLELLDDDALEVAALPALFAADAALAAPLFFWKPDAPAKFKPIIPDVSRAAMAQAHSPLFVLSTCHFMTCTPVCPGSIFGL